MKFLYKSRGAVSIFLVIILLPMMTIAGVYVDMTRTKLAQEVAVSSADLALNTVLSDYDKDLKDLYGLIASAQDVNDVKEAAEKYFQSCMVSAGVDVSDAQIYVDNVMDAFVGDEDIRDLLQISVVPAGDGGIISAMENGAMNNPAMVKNGIIEFMKYRAPVDGAAKLFEAISNSDVQEQLENSGHEAKMIAAREDFYEAEKKLLKQAKEAYSAIKNYMNFKSHLGFKISDEKFLDNLSLFLMHPDGEENGSFEEVFKEAHFRMVKNLYNTRNGDTTMTKSLLSTSYAGGTQPVTTYSSDNLASASKIEDLLEAFNDALTNYMKSRANLKSSWESVGSYNSSTDWHVQYWVRITDKCKSNYNTYVGAMTNLRKAYRSLENAGGNPAEKAMDEKIKKLSSDYVSFPTPDKDNKLTLQQIYDSLMNYFNHNLKSEVEGNGSSAYNSINSAINTVSRVADPFIQLSTVGHIYNIRNSLNKYIDDLEEAESLVKTAASEVADLKKKLDAYKTAFQKWDQLAFDSAMNDSEIATAEPTDPNNPLTGGDRAQITYWKEVGIDHFSKESVEDLKGRLEKIQTVCKSFKEDMEDIKYRSTKVININEFRNFRDAANLDTNRIVVNNAQLEAYAEESFTFTIGDQINWIVIHDSVMDGTFKQQDHYYITRSYHLDLDKTEHELLNWMRAKFDGKQSGDPVDTGFGITVNNEGTANDADDVINDQKENVDGVSTSGNVTKNDISAWKGKTLPSKYKNYEAEDKDLSAKIDDAANYASDLFSNFGETFGNTLVNVRDHLYTVDYVMSMFTHDTFDKEGYYDNVADEKKNQVSALDQSLYTDDVKEAWKNSDENLTLTRMPRNEANNWAYGSEIEYILYGNSSNAKNKTTAYASIYLIRYALDLAPIFKMYWNDQIVVSIATALQTFAFIPAGVTKAVICLAITAGEAGADIAQLKAGVPVLIYKSRKEDVICNYSSIFSGGNTNNPNPDNRPALQYSDYLMMFLFVKLTGSGEQAVYSRIADIIQINVAVAKNEKDTFELAKSVVAYKLNAKVQIAPMWSRLLAIDNIGDLSTSEGWRTFTVEAISSY